MYEKPEVMGGRRYREHSQLEQVKPRIVVGKVTATKRLNHFSNIGKVGRSSDSENCGKGEAPVRGQLGRDPQREGKCIEFIIKGHLQNEGSNWVGLGRKVIQSIRPKIVITPKREKRTLRGEEEEFDMLALITQRHTGI